MFRPRDRLGRPAVKLDPSLGSNVVMIHRTSKDPPDIAKKIQDEFPNLTVRGVANATCDFDNLQETFNRIEQDLKTSSAGVTTNAGISIIPTIFGCNARNLFK
ncbi:hypothetical protein HD554DRAFT_25635 [Boletus coccyginus]|nr:hypothetical protein HD554DRAFT_25635 [Boletus coccyginus]